MHVFEPRPSHDGARVVALARRWIGTPYHHQASVHGVGTDCLGLVRGLMRDLYGFEPEAPPPYSRDWAEQDNSEPLLAAASRHLSEIDDLRAARPGDLLAFRWRSSLPAKHLGIMAAPLSFVHAAEGAVVSEIPFAPWWRRRLVAVFRFPAVLHTEAPR